MIPELGHFALILAFCFALLLGIIPFMGLRYTNSHLSQLTKPLVCAEFFFIMFSYVCLTYAFVVNDFSVSYVAMHSSRELPWLYRLTAVWGGHEGSMLLWVSILAIWTLLVLVKSQPLPDDIRQRVLAILGLLTAGFLLFLLATSNPFLRLLPHIPSDGRDLNPLLQDPGFWLHPPILYLGYVGFAVPFAFAITALLSGRLDATWAEWSRPWTLLAWCFLTLGITLGSWWAYRELGWGGWWFWDPVENASLLPWLVGTGLVHSLIVTQKRNSFKAWTLMLAILAFTLSLIGTFLVRSGVLTSVHSFAVDPTRGAFMLAYIAVVIGVSFTLYALRISKLTRSIRIHILSRETLLLANNVIFITLMGTVLLGTLYPLLIDALGLGKLSVGAPYFNRVVVPLALPLLFLMGIAPHCQWQRMSWSLLVNKLRYILLFSIALGILLPLLLTHTLSWSVFLGLMFAFWILSSTLQYVLTTYLGGKRLSQSHWGMVVAHIGVAVLVIGIVVTSAYSVERDVRVKLGETINLANYQLKFENIVALNGPNYKGVDAVFHVSKHNRVFTTLHAQKRIYTVTDMPMTDAAIAANLWRDIYVALGKPLTDDQQVWSVRVYYKPFVRWLWLGGILILIGGLLAALDPRYRGKALLRTTRAAARITPNELGLS